MSLLQQLRRRVFHRYHQRPLVLDVLVCGFLPGALLGTQLAGLLLFLNAHLDSDLLPLALLYGPALGLVSLLLHLPFTLQRPDRARRALPWGLTLALLIPAVAEIGHASYYAFYLPPGINTRLIKAGMVLSLAGLVAFYTTLLHTIHRRRYGRRSRWGYAVLVLISVFSLEERLETYRPPEIRPRTAAEGPERPRLRLYTVAVEGATLDAILPLAEQGRVPFLAAMLRDGAAGRLETLTPYSRAAVWTSLATGKNPYRHGILGDRVWPFPPLGPEARFELLPAGILFRTWGLPGVRPLPVDRRRQRALDLWQVLSRLGVRSATLGWPVTDPPFGELDFSVSEAFFRPEPPPGSALPEGVAERAALFALGVGDLGPVRRNPFGPDPSPRVLSALAGDGWRQSLSLFLVEQYPDVDALFLVLPGLASVSEESFGGYAEVQFEGGDGEAERAAHDELAAYYGGIDRFLARLWERVPQPAMLAVVSPAGTARRGWGWGLSGDPELRGTLGAGADGVLMFLGGDIEPGTRFRGARLTDLVPTVAYAFGLPIAKDLDGQVITAAFDPVRVARQPLSFVPTYESLALSEAR